VSWLVWTGAGLALAGVALLAVAIRRALRLRAPGTGEAEAARLLKSLAALNAAAVALAALGLALMVFGGLRG